METELGVEVEFVELDKLKDSAPAVEPGAVESTGVVPVGILVPPDAGFTVGPTTDELG